MVERLLFVDDEPDLELLIRQKFRRQMRSGAMELDFARDGREALAKIDARDIEYDVIVTDLNMPEMNGLELLSELSRRELSSVVLVLSAYGDMGNIRAAMNRGAFDFLTKPIDFRDLEITKDKALAHLQSLREQERLLREKERLETRARFVRETFGRYLSDSVVQTLLDAPDGLRLGGEKRDVSILMSDLRGFTTMCERLPPEEVVALLNLYFGAMTDIVMDHGGTIDELLGDAMLVIFGAPLAQDDHADRAVACGLQMQAAMAEVNRRAAERGLPELRMGIGIDTGPLVVGNIGSARRSKYGVVGRHVNLTARIEAMTSGGQVLVSDDTRRRCTLDLVSNGELTFEVKGFADPVTVHDIRGVRGHVMLPELSEIVVAEGQARRERATRSQADEAPAGPAAAATGTSGAQEHLATIGLMIAGIAHDIRNPLGFIVNFSDLSAELLDEVLRSLPAEGMPESEREIGADLEVVKANLEKIKEHGVRANELVRSMVETLRGAQGPIDEVDLNACVSRHLELFETSLRATDPELELRIELELDPTAGRIAMSPQDVGRILLNLVQNACDAARAKGPELRGGEPPRVWVRTVAREDAVQLRVRDDGLGIPPAVRAAMFQPFFTTKGKRGGLGLGLAFVRTMVEAHGGTIEVETEEGRFTEMAVTLPRAASPG
ncbi:MAG: response regulator [Myxococcales bacterium]|nr:response regulator [Myxococcales bacterium]